MKDQIERIYSTFVTRAYRRPRSVRSGDLPLLVATADLPVPKRHAKSGRLVVTNHGLHYHGLLVVPPTTRLKISVEQHFREHESTYLGSDLALQRFMVKTVTSDHGYIVDYVFKTVLRGQLPYDGSVVVLPRSRHE
jgi:hypothetical protein